MANYNATYKQYNGTSWDVLYFKTSAGQVGESSTLYFLRPATHKVNGKSFLNGTTHQGITLYAGDIALSSSDSTTILAKLNTIANSIPSLSGYATQSWVTTNYAAKDHNHSQYAILDGNNAFTGNIEVGGTLYTIGNATFEGQITATDGYIDTVYADTVKASYLQSAGGLSITVPEKSGTLALTSDIKTYSNATTSAAGLMSSTDKTRIDSIWNVWSADGTDNTLVDKVQEVLTVFNNYPEGTNLITALNGKLDKTGGTVDGQLIVNNDLDVKGSFSVSGGDSYLEHVEAESISLVAQSMDVGDGNYTMTFPTKSGTVALTSDLSNYAAKSHSHAWSAITGKPTILDGNSVSTVLDLSSYGATDLISAPALKNSLDYFAANDHDHDSTYLRIADSTTVFRGSTTPTGMKTGDIWLQYN